MEWERVLTVHDFYDRPRTGVAHFHGVPDIYNRVFDEDEDEYSDQYWLTEIVPDALKLVMEQWEIFERWQVALKQGTVTLGEPQSIPSDRQRDDVLKKLIGDLLYTTTESSTLRGAEFRYRDGQCEVRWSEPPARSKSTAAAPGC